MAEIGLGQIRVMKTAVSEIGFHAFRLGQIGLSEINIVRRAAGHDQFFERQPAEG